MFLSDLHQCHVLKSFLLCYHKKVLILKAIYTLLSMWYNQNHQYYQVIKECLYTHSLFFRVYYICTWIEIILFLDLYYYLLLDLRFIIFLLILVHSIYFLIHLHPMINSKNWIWYQKIYSIFLSSLYYFFYVYFFFLF